MFVLKWLIQWVILVALPFQLQAALEETYSQQVHRAIQIQKSIEVLQNRVVPLDSDPLMLFSEDHSEMSLRSQFSDEELEMLLAWREMQRELLKAIELEFTSHSFANQVLQTIIARPRDWTGKITFKHLQRLTRKNWSQYRNIIHLLHPFALLYLDPNHNGDLDQMVEEMFLGLKNINLELGDQRRDRKIVEKYKEMRDKDNLGWEGTNERSGSNIHLSFVDSGLDYNELAKVQDVLLKRHSGFGSYDYSDNDEDVWARSIGVMGHGTGVVDSVMKVFERFNFNTSFTLSMAKVLSTRFFLSGQFLELHKEALGGGLVDNSVWENRHDRIQRAILDLVDKSSDSLQNIVNLSLVPPKIDWSYQLLGQKMEEKRNLMWILAAGNSGQKVGEGDTNCLLDLPNRESFSDRILCIGVLDKDGKQVHRKSNFGLFVDLYTQESFSDLCPGLTSCGTPGISATMAMLKSEFASLSFEDLRKVILKASEIQTFVKNGESFEGRVFIPQIHYVKAQALAVAMEEARNK